MRRIRTFSYLSILVALFLPWNTGCSGHGPNAFPQELSDTVRQVGTSVTDQAVWQDVLARLNGQVIEPGVETYAGVLYVAGVKLAGTSGQLSLEGEGSGAGQLSPEARTVLMELGRRPDLIEKIKAAFDDGETNSDGTGG